MNGSALRRYFLLALVVIGIIADAAVATAQTSVFVSGTAGGNFGYPSEDIVPLVTAITVTGPGTITVTYVSGIVDWATGKPTGPNGAPWPYGGCQLPLQEAEGVSHENAPDIGALMGAFVPQTRAQRVGFSPLDGTKNATTVGISPGTLFFIGTSKTFSVSEAGTLFLGINDCEVADNSGGFNVNVNVTEP